MGYFFPKGGESQIGCEPTKEMIKMFLLLTLCKQRVNQCFPLPQQHYTNTNHCNQECCCFKPWDTTTFTPFLLHSYCYCIRSSSAIPVRNSESSMISSCLIIGLRCVSICCAVPIIVSIPIKIPLIFC